MNILGVGGWELLAILLIMLLVAGPKRMIHWAYILGQYVSKFRTMWAETVDVIQKEFDDAGVDIKIPKEPPTRGSLNQHAGKALETFARPVKEVMDEATGEVKQITNVTSATASTANAVVRGNGHSRQQKPRPQRPSAASTSLQARRSSSSQAFGTWSGDAGSESDQFGTWSAGGEKRSDSEE
jgi:Sec-independent protein translocase protein TatA